MQVSSDTTIPMQISGGTTICMNISGDTPIGAQCKPIWGCNIELLQQYAGVSDEELAEGAGISTQTIWVYKVDPDVIPRATNQDSVAQFFTEKIGRQFTRDDIFGRVIQAEELPSEHPPPVTIKVSLKPENGEGLLSLEAQLTFPHRWSEHQIILAITSLANLSLAVERMNGSLAGARHIKSQLMLSNPSSQITDLHILDEVLGVELARRRAARR